MTEGQPKGITPTEYAFNTLKKMVGFDAYQDYLERSLRRSRETGHPPSLGDAFMSTLDGFAQISFPLYTEHFRREPYRSLYDRPLGERLSIATKMSFDLASMFFPITSVMHGYYDLTMISTGVKIFGYNLVAAVAPDVIKSVKQRSSL